MAHNISFFAQYFLFTAFWMRQIKPIGDWFSEVGMYMFPIVVLLLGFTTDDDALKWNIEME